MPVFSVVMFISDCVAKGRTCIELYSFTRLYTYSSGNGNLPSSHLKHQLLGQIGETNYLSPLPVYTLPFALVASLPSLHNMHLYIIPQTIPYSHYYCWITFKVSFQRLFY